MKREEPIHHLGDGNIISDGIAFGINTSSYQRSADYYVGRPQSTGGYTKIGTVISVDLPKLAQSVPGYRVRFIHVGIELAQKLYIRQLQKLHKLEKELGQRS